MTYCSMYSMQLPSTTTAALSLQREWEDKITEKRNALENLYLENVRHVGEGHQAALMVSCCY